MKIPFRMPVELPGDTLIEYTITHIWRNGDGVKIIDRHELRLDFDTTKMSCDEAQRVVDKIREANAEMKSSANYSVSGEQVTECVIILFKDEELLGPTEDHDLYQPLPEKKHEQTPIEWLA